MKVTIANKNGGKLDIEIMAFPIIDNGFLRLVTKGTFIDIEECMFLNLEYIAGINYEK